MAFKKGPKHFFYRNKVFVMPEADPKIGQQFAEGIFLGSEDYPE